MTPLTLITPGQELPLSALIDGARFAEQSGAFDDALEGYRAAIKRIHAGEEITRGPTVLRWIGRVHFERGEYEEAHGAFEAALVNAQALGQREDSAAALNGMAVTEQFRGRLDVAEALYERACTLADEVGNTKLAATIDQNLGTLANIRGDLGTAMVRYQAALERFRELGLDTNSAWVLNNMGMLHVDVGEWAAAELCFNSGFQLAERTGDTASLAKIECNRAELYLKRQNFERARECCERAFKLCSVMGSDVGLGEIHKYYGVLYRETGKPQVAHVQLGLALKLAKSCENPLLEAETESERALLFISQKQLAPALQSLKRAQRLFTDLDARREILDLRRRLERLEGTYMRAVQLLADETVVQEQQTGNRRGKRVAELASMLAESVGYDEVIWLRIGAFLKDVGNRALPTQVLEKAGPLSDEEWALVKSHTILGDELIKKLDFPEDVRPIVRSHHEHWDGSGYPDNLVGDQIPLAARILCIADVYDALTSARAYRAAYNTDQAIEIMQSESGKVFDPRLLQQFVRLIKMGGPGIVRHQSMNDLKVAI